MTNGTTKRVVALDTMILVWGLRKKDGPKEHIVHAEYLFKQLEAEEADILLPSVVVAEFIAPVLADRRTGVVAELNKRFRIEPFDVRDVVLAAQLWEFGKAGRQMNKPNARTILRSDCYIVATAKGHSASVFYTEDNDLLALASKVMDAQHLPVIAPSLLDWRESE